MRASSARSSCCSAQSKFRLKVTCMLHQALSLYTPCGFISNNLTRSDLQTPALSFPFYSLAFFSKFLYLFSSFYPWNRPSYTWTSKNPRNPGRQPADGTKETQTPQPDIAPLSKIETPLQNCSRKTIDLKMHPKRSDFPPEFI
ncbi:hypothetical protein N656DRAFT_417303 [Canariomyces notabilis]|uniref:Uncharacterized protein n=1 Tax=Canariomyces notabilis TaxID=2074819 RepID=A0AAN6QEI4_9PEZI|nr:hypothetical protein N656DRAFT_417303 [Canariomyces arenarius]